MSEHSRSASPRRARCLIVDDEAPARSELRALLGAFDHIQVVGEATNAEEALVLLREVNYDLVLLDVRMPGGTGLDVARAIAADPTSPAVIFTTAYPDYAVEAFDLAAADYLVKPFDEARLGRALQRALSGTDDDDVRSVPSPAARLTRGWAADRQPIPVQVGDRTVLVDPGNVVYATAARGYSYLKLHDERVLVSMTLAELERRLDERFVRVHRSHLVNLDHVRELVSDYAGGLVLVTDDAQRSRVEVARRQAAGVRRALGV